MTRKTADRALENYFPVTFRIGVLESPIDVVTEAFSSWKSTLFDSVDVQGCDDGLDGIKSALPPLEMPPRRSLLIETRSGWTAYLDNSILGTDAVGPIVHLADVVGCRGVIATNFPHTLESESGRENGTYGAVQFELYGPGAGNPLGCLRSISVAYDGGKWRFDESGTVQPFEDTTLYSQRRIVDRFTPSTLEDYCSAMGLSLFDESFYCGRSYVVSFRNAQSEPARVCSLAEARSELGVPG